MSARSIIFFIIIAILIIVFIAILPLVYLWFGISIMSNPPEPEIVSSDFDFELRYEIDGENVIIKDTAVFTFNGYRERTEAGQSRKWQVETKGNTSLKDENGSLLISILDVSKQNEYDDFGNKILELYFYGGNGYYYMSDELGNHDRDEQELNHICYRYETKDGIIGHSSLDEDISFTKYKIRLISWKCSPPIENTFKH